MEVSRTDSQETARFLSDAFEEMEGLRKLGVKVPMSIRCDGIKFMFGKLEENSGGGYVFQSGEADIDHARAAKLVHRLMDRVNSSDSGGRSVAVCTPDGACALLITDYDTGRICCEGFNCSQTSAACS